MSVQAKYLKNQHRKTAEILTSYGYRRISRKHGLISRIDRPDWREVMAKKMFLTPEQIGVSLCDHYRRCFSKDTLQVGERLVLLIPTSSGDRVSYINTWEVYKEQWSHNGSVTRAVARSMINCADKEIFYPQVQGISNLTEQKDEESKMIKVSKKSVWTDGQNVTHNVSEMSDDYVRNCIVFCQRRVQILREVNDTYESADIQEQVSGLEESVETLVAEMDYRRENGISISRTQGCEGRNRNRTGIDF